MTEFRTSEDRRMLEHMFHRDMRRLIKHYRTEGSIDPDLVNVINDYERLHGEVQIEEDDW